MISYKIPGVKANISFEAPYDNDPSLIDIDKEAENIITQITYELDRLEAQKNRENSGEFPEFTGNISAEIQRLAKMAGVPVSARPHVDRRKDSRRYKFSTGRKVATKKECNDLYNLLEEVGIKVKEVYSKDNNGMYPYYNELLVEIFV